MPAGFDNCVRHGGKVITKSDKKSGTYRHYCLLAGKWHIGEIKKKKGTK